MIRQRSRVNQFLCIIGSFDLLRISICVISNCFEFRSLGSRSAFTGNLITSLAAVANTSSAAVDLWNAGAVPYLCEP